MLDGLQFVLRFEPDRQIAVGGFSVLGPKLFGTLRDFVMKRGVFIVGSEGAGSVWFLHKSDN